MSLMAALAAGCSSDDIVDDGGKKPGIDPNGKAYVGLSISLPSTNGTRSANDAYDMGDPDEYKVNSLTVRYLKEDKVTEIESFTYAGETLNKLIWSTPPAGTGITTTAVLPVEKVDFSGAAYALVEINSPFDGNIAANDVQDITANKLTGDAQNSFFMTNTVYKDGHYLVPVTTSPTEDGAKNLAATHTIYVERAAAKVQLNVASIGTDGWNGSTYTIPATANNGGAKINIKSWVLDVTNKKMFPIRKFRGDIAYENGGLPATDFPRFYSWNNADFRTYWAEDPNYSNYYSKDGAEDETNNFNVKTVYPGEEEEESAKTVPNALNAVEYCAENTFNVPNQRQSQTTRALIQATYTPSGFMDNETWYTLGNSSTPLHANDVVSLVEKATNKTGASLTEEKIAAGEQEFTAEMIGGITLAEDGSDLAKVKQDLGKITAYKGGVCYYAVRIKHFGNEICPWGDEITGKNDDGSDKTGVSGIKYDQYANDYENNTKKYDQAYLGRYGVVRNNWYKITINSVSQPGTPVIPELSKEQDDEHYNYLQSTINILDWAVREQGVIL